MLALRRALLTLLALGIVSAGLVATVTLASRHEPDKALAVLSGVVIGLSFIGVGLFAWWRRPLNRFGVLMTGVGFAWFMASLTAANASAIFTIASYLGPLYIALVVHSEPEDREAWRTSVPHKHAVEMSPKLYTSVRIYNGHLPGGVAGSRAIEIDSTKYWDYEVEPMWRAVRVFDPPLTRVRRQEPHLD